jgi:hypothetical protein
LSTGGGGEVVKNNFLLKNIFGTKGNNNLQVFNQLNLAALDVYYLTIKLMAAILKLLDE